MANPANRKALGTPGRPASLQHEHQACVGGHVVAGNRLDRAPVLRLPAISRHLPASKSSNLCENRPALAHPGELPICFHIPRERHRNSAASMGRRSYAITPLSLQKSTGPTSDEERQNRKLAGRAFLKVLGMTSPIA